MITQKVFLNLQKNCFIQSQIRKLIIEEQELTFSHLMFLHFTKIFFQNKLILNKTT